MKRRTVGLGDCGPEKSGESEESRRRAVYPRMATIDQDDLRIRVTSAGSHILFVIDNYETLLTPRESHDLARILQFAASAVSRNGRFLGQCVTSSGRTFESGPRTNISPSREVRFSFWGIAEGGELASFVRAFPLLPLIAEDVARALVASADDAQAALNASGASSVLRALEKKGE